MMKTAKRWGSKLNINHELHDRFKVLSRTSGITMKKYVELLIQAEIEQPTLVHEGRVRKIAR